MPSEDLPVAEFAFPGALRDQLVAAIVAGGKTTTTGLVAEYEKEGAPLPEPGLRQVVVDSAGNPVAVIETTSVQVMRLGDVDLAHAWVRVRDMPRSRNGGPGMSGSGIRHRCAKPWVTRNSRWTTTPSSWPRYSGSWRTRGWTGLRRQAVVPPPAAVGG
jgi:hypothetical protein